MKYKSSNGREYTLIENTIIFRGGKQSKFYYFVGKEVIDHYKKVGKKYKEAKELPPLYEIVEIKRNGTPLVQKKRI